jgi:hypothetical protein
MLKMVDHPIISKVPTQTTDDMQLNARICCFKLNYRIAPIKQTNNTNVLPYFYDV